MCSVARYYQCHHHQHEHWNIDKLFPNVFWHICTYKHICFWMDVIKMISGRVELMATALICQEAINVLAILASRNWWEFLKECALKVVFCYAFYLCTNLYHFLRSSQGLPIPRSLENVKMSMSACRRHASEVISQFCRKYQQKEVLTVSPSRGYLSMY